MSQNSENLKQTITIYQQTTGYDPNKSTFMAVEKFKRFGKRATLGIEGNIVGAWNKVDYNILIQLISKRIRDKDFINLMKSLLKSGVLYQSKYTHAIKETLQGGIVSPPPSIQYLHVRTR